MNGIFCKHKFMYCLTLPTPSQAWLSCSPAGAAALQGSSPSSPSSPMKSALELTHASGCCSLVLHSVPSVPAFACAGGCCSLAKPGHFPAPTSVSSMVQSGLAYHYSQFLHKLADAIVPQRQARKTLHNLHPRSSSLSSGGCCSSTWSSLSPNLNPQVGIKV